MSMERISDSSNGNHEMNNVLSVECSKEEELRKTIKQLQDLLEKASKLAAASSSPKQNTTTTESKENGHDGTQSTLLSSPTASTAQVVSTVTLTATPSSSQMNAMPKPVTKRGYLFKWQDRSIGWGGTKWALRFVSLDCGRISYYANHNSPKPYYSTSLGGCAVRDDGYKRNRKHIVITAGNDTNNIDSTTNSNNTLYPPLEETGAYFHVFCIYQRLDNHNYNGSNDDDDESESDDDDEEDEICVPLLRFSTPSLAEKNQWIQLISESCAYCETDQFITDEQIRIKEIENQREQQLLMSTAMPEARPGTLPPLYFAPAVVTNNANAQNTTTNNQQLISNHRQTFASGKSTPTSKKPTLYRSKSKNSNLDSDGKTNSSTTKKTEFDQDNRYIKGYPPSKPMHRVAAASYLSEESPGIQNYRGLFNLAIIILVLSNFRLLLTTIRDNGLCLLHLIPYFNDNDNENDDNSIILILNYLFHGLMKLNIFIVLSFLIELILSKNMMKSSSSFIEKIGMFLHYTNAHSCLVITSYIVWNSGDSNPILNAVLLLHGVTIWMKIISYAHCNQDHRLQHKAHYFNSNKNKKKLKRTSSTSKIASDKIILSLIENLNPFDIEMTYPRNITLGNIYYFMFAPTLTYQIAFPRTPRVRILKVIGILARLIITASIFTFLLVQDVKPTLSKLTKELELTNGLYTIQILANYWLTLSVTNCYLWLLMFYWYFHLYLNFFAEILKFGDRVFYKDWWNSSDVSSYWRLWNLPVHYWLIRHLYFPCLRLKYMNRMSATFIVFFFSAILHEVLVSLPFHMIRPWSFLGMMMQLPLIFGTKVITRKFPGSSIGNIIFWISFCIVGQPMAIMLYTVDYQLWHDSNIITMTNAIALYKPNNNFYFPYYNNATTSVMESSEL